MHLKYFLNKLKNNVNWVVCCKLIYTSVLPSVFFNSLRNQCYAKVNLSQFYRQIILFIVTSRVGVGWEGAFFLLGWALHKMQRYLTYSLRYTPTEFKQIKSKQSTDYCIFVPNEMVTMYKRKTEQWFYVATNKKKIFDASRELDRVNHWKQYAKHF